MKIKIGKKELNIKYGYKPTLKERIVSKAVRLGKVTDENGEMNMEKVEDLLMFLPEMLLVGLQVHHKEYRYDLNTGEGKEEQLDKAFALVDEYMSDENAEAMGLFNSLQDALLQDSFLASLFREDQKAEAAEDVLAEQEKN